jgi:hypothetical protein
LREGVLNGLCVGWPRRENIDPERP